MEKLAGILLMAGSSVRFGGPKNKLFCPLNGKPVFTYAIDTFAKQTNISELIIVVSKDNMEEVQKYIDENKIDATLVLGGEKRQESVRNGLNAVKNLKDDDVIVVHDAARPLVDAFIINQVAKAADEVGAATAYLEATDTIAIKNKKDEITSFVLRDSVAQIQTPQAFKFAFLKNAHQWAKDANATDDCSLILMEGHKVKLVKGDKKYHKITRQEDILYLEGLLKQ